MSVYIVWFCVVWSLIAFHIVYSAIDHSQSGGEVAATEGTVDPPVMFAYHGSNKETFADVEFIKNEAFFPRFKPNLIYPICPIDLNDVIFYAKKRYNSIEELNQAEELKCRYNFLPSILKTKENDEHSYEIGYEINMTSYRVENEEEFLTTYPNIRNDYLQDSTYWVPFYYVKFNHGVLISEYVSHRVYPLTYSNNYLEKCLDYRFGQNVIGRDVEYFYGEENQHNLFKNLGISTTSPPYGYFVKHLLAPIQDNVNRVVRLGLCSHLNVVPLWQKVSEGSVRKVEEFIRRVADIIGYVSVKTAAFGTLQFPNDVYLDSSSEKIPVPSIISKSLTFEVNTEGFTVERYSLDVFIHNEPKDRIKERICYENVCETLGWDFGIDNDEEIGLTYCCFIYNEAFPSYLKKSNGYDTEHVKIFDLNNIPVRYDGWNIENVNVVERLKQGSFEN